MKTDNAVNLDSKLFGPENKQVCIELHRLRLLSDEQLRVDTLYYRRVLTVRDWRGYHLWGAWVVARMRRYPALAKWLRYPVGWLASDSAHQLGMAHRPHVAGMLVRRLFFIPLCRVIGIVCSTRRAWALHEASSAANHAPRV